MLCKHLLFRKQKERRRKPYALIALDFFAGIIADKPSFKRTIQRRRYLLQLLFAKIVPFEFSAEILGGTPNPCRQFLQSHIALDECNFDFLSH